MLLRPYAKSDLPALYALDQACFPPGIAYSRGELLFFLSHPRSFTFVAEEAGQVAGFCICEHLRKRGRLHGHIITIDVAPQFRNQRCGMRLMEAMEERLRAAAATAITLEVAVDNQPAQNFYLRHGFAFTGRIRGYYSNGLDAFTMQKPLAA